MLQPSLAVPAQVIPEGSRVEVFQAIYWVFLGLGTLVGTIVIGYMLYNAYKYRDDGGEDTVEDRPELGELPTGGGKGRKLFLSFALSAIVVVSLVVWTYGTLLYVENAAANDTGVNGEDVMTIRVEGYQFDWRYYYPNGNVSQELVIPEDRTVRIQVTSADVWHNFGMTAFRVKSDAIPGQWTTTWFVAEEAGFYEDGVQCYELCGTGHSIMKDNVTVMEASEFDAWYDNRTAQPDVDAPCPPESDALDCQDQSQDGEGSGEEGDHGGSESLRVPESRPAATAGASTPTP